MNKEWSYRVSMEDLKSIEYITYCPRKAIKNYFDDCIYNKIDIPEKIEISVYDYFNDKTFNYIIKPYTKWELDIELLEAEDII